MDNNVACIDQNPVALAQAFRPYGFNPSVFQTFHEVRCNGANVPIRPPGRDDHSVGKHCFSDKVDRGHFHGLIIFKGFLHKLKEFMRRFLDQLILGFYEGSLLLRLFPIILSSFSPICRIAVADPG